MPADDENLADRTAYDLKDVHRALEGLTNDALKQIPVLSPGARLTQGGVYVDLHDPARREFKASGDITADADHWYVAKNAVDYELWNRLIGIDNPDRLYPIPDPEVAKTHQS
jgi:hypothetical protein